ncbi:MAG: glycosyltransferase family 4 protein [Parcubacteria group bacterium]|nr:glycosyltransferase family 4 protein [Parcubacteria group bacterium]
MPKVKILYVITKSNFGGAQRYVYDLATSLKTGDFDVAVLLGGDGLLKQKLEHENIRTISLPSLQRDINIVKEVKTFFAFLKILYTERPDIVHVNSSKAGGLGAFAVRFYNMLAVSGSKTKVIFTAHGWAFNEERPWFQKKTILFLHWLTMLLAHATIAVSEEAKRQVDHLPFMKEKITVIPNGIGASSPLDREGARRALARRAEALTETTSDTIWVGTIAELHKTKGLAYMIEAMRLLSQKPIPIKYVIIGDGEELGTLSALAKKHGLEDRVFLTGFIPEAALCLSAFDIFVLPSLSEALGYAILEAGNAGAATIASNVGGIPEIIEDGRNGILVPTRSPVHLANAVSTLAEDAEKRKHFGEALRVAVREQFSKDNMVRATVALYKN